YDHGPEQAISPYAEIPHLPEDLVRRTRATYAALTTMVDRWFGHFLEALRVGGWLDDTLVIVASDHGHSLHERSYTGKRGYPSEPEVIDTILLLRRPRAEAAGTTCDAWVQHHDIAGTILDAAGLGAPIHGRSLLDVASGASSTPAHVVVGWGPAVTVIDDSWWLNCKVDGRGPLLYGRGAGEGGRGDANLAEDHPEVVRKMYELAVAEADGRFPGYLLEEAHSTEDAPGCSPFAAIPLAGS
ncbi:MAG: sulfatase-like hydrolase/transferase, partial [Actinomycetota bacterium]